MSTFSEIQSGKENSGIKKFVPVQQGDDFFRNLAECRDDGEKIEQFLQTAQRADVPLLAIEELLNYQDEFILAMGLQSFGYISNQQIKDKLRNFEHIEELDEPLEEIYQQPDPAEYKNHSVMIYEKLCKEANSGSNLIRLSAAWALQQLGYSQKAIGKFLSKSPEDIQIQVISENSKRLLDRSTINDVVRYKECINFWVYAPKVHLFQLLRTITPSNSSVVEDILERLGVGGVESVTRTPESFPKFVVEVGLRLANSLIRYKKYQDKVTKDKLSTVLIPFLDNRDIDLRRLAAQPINDVGSWLNIEVRARAALICRDWNTLEEFGEVSIPFLLQAMQEKIMLDAENNSREQARAVGCIAKIYSGDVIKRISTLSAFLQHKQQVVRYTTVSVLKTDKNRLDIDSQRILTALDFEFELEEVDLQSFDIQSLNNGEIEKEIDSWQKYQNYIETIFEDAISSCKTQATEIRNYLAYQLDNYTSRVTNYLNKLSKQKNYLLEKQAQQKAEEDKKRIAEEKRRVEEERKRLDAERQKAEERAERERIRAQERAEEQRIKTIVKIRNLVFLAIVLMGSVSGGKSFIYAVFSCFLASYASSYFLVVKGAFQTLWGWPLWYLIFSVLMPLIGGIPVVIFGKVNNLDNNYMVAGLLSGTIMGIITGVMSGRQAKK